MTAPPLLSRRAILGGAAGAALAVAAGAGTASATGTPAGWPTELPLPNGFRPEGITIGTEPYAYMGSLGTGAVHRADLRTGRGKIIYEGAAGASAVGMKVDHDGLLYISGGADGSARILDTRTGKFVATYQPAPGRARLSASVHSVTMLRTASPPVPVASLVIAEATCWRCLAAAPF
jgi:streptogramin lyase